MVKLSNFVKKVLVLVLMLVKFQTQAQLDSGYTTSTDALAGIAQQFKPFFDKLRLNKTDDEFRKLVVAVAQTRGAQKTAIIAAAEYYLKNLS